MVPDPTVQLFRDNIFPPFLLDNNNREKKKERE